MSEENNDIGKFFSSRLNEGDIPFEEGDWKAMKDKLDEFDALTSSSGLSGWYIAGITLMCVLLFLSGWYGHQWIVDNSNPSLSTIDIAMNSSENSQHDLNSGQLPITDSSDLKKNVLSGEKSGNATGRSLERSKTLVPSERLQAEMLSSEQNNSLTEVIYANGSDNSIASGSLVNTSIVNNTGNKAVPRGSSTNPEEYTLTLMRLSIIKPDWTPQLPELDLYVLPLPEIALPDIRGLEIPEKEEGFQQTKGWSLGITIAPDLNAVGSASNYRLAWEAGITATYNMTRNWRVSTGILYAKKAYQANGTDYNPPEGYWDNTTNGIVPDEVAARCGIIDVPLNLTYIWNPKGRVHFTTTIGLSNYFILNEDYEYSFGYQYPASGYSGWSTQENSSAFFGMLNVGLGVEWEMRSNWFVSMEPYFKVPLKEIGFGSVPLRGTGVFFSIRKQLNRK